MSRTIRHLLDKKGSQVHTIGQDQTVYEAIEQMDQHRVGSLVVVDAPASNRVVGIITERDYLRKIALAGRTSQTTHVKEIMTANPVVVGPNRAIEAVMEIMTAKRVRHLPVMEGETLVGLISIGDVVQAVSKEQETTIHYLEGVLNGTNPLMPH